MSQASDRAPGRALFQRLGDSYGHVLLRHRDLMRAEFDRYGGCEVDTQGEAFFVAFPDAVAAVEAATASLRAGREQQGAARGVNP